MINKKIYLDIPKKKYTTEYRGTLISDIKFPCLCTFFNGQYRGIITMSSVGADTYELFYLDRKDLCAEQNRNMGYDDLETLLINADVELKEGAIVFYDYNE